MFRVINSPELTGKVGALEMLFLGSGFTASLSEGDDFPEMPQRAEEPLDDET